jgi:hypothetical protein
MLRTQGWFCEVAAEALQSSSRRPPSRPGRHYAGISNLQVRAVNPNNCTPHPATSCRSGSPARDWDVVEPPTRICAFEPPRGTGRWQTLAALPLDDRLADLPLPLGDRPDAGGRSDRPHIVRVRPNLLGDSPVTSPSLSSRQTCSSAECFRIVASFAAQTIRAREITRMKQLRSGRANGLDYCSNPNRPDGSHEQPQTGGERLTARGPTW